MPIRFGEAKLENKDRTAGGLFVEVCILQADFSSE